MNGNICHAACDLTSLAYTPLNGNNADITKIKYLVKINLLFLREEKAVLKGIDPIINAELIHALMLMGQGDQLVLLRYQSSCTNHRASNDLRPPDRDFSGCGLERAAQAILKLFSRWTHSSITSQTHAVCRDPDRQVPIIRSMQAVIDRSEGHPFW